MQAFLHKHAPRNSRYFFPETLRELAPTERLGGDAVSYVKLEGLGKIAFSSIRRPKPLMEFGAAPEGEAGNSSAGHQLQICRLCGQQGGQDCLQQHSAAKGAHGFPGRPSCSMLGLSCMRCCGPGWAGLLSAAFGGPGRSCSQDGLSHCMTVCRSKSSWPLPAAKH